MKTLSQHIEEKLVINKDIKTIGHLNPESINVGDPIYAVDFSSGGVVMPHIGTLSEPIKYNDVFEIMFLSTEATGQECFWEVDAIYDGTDYCFVRFDYSHNNDIENVSLIFLENNKDAFMNLVKSLKPNAEYTLKTIFKRLYIDFDSFCNKYGNEWIKYHKYWFSCNKKEYNEFLKKM